MTAVSSKRQSEREELLGMLLDRGILCRSETQPVLSRDGTSARWMLDSLAVTLTPRGAELAGRLVLEHLRRFDGRQLATFGLTAVPILQSAVLQSAGRYHGLSILPCSHIWCRGGRLCPPPLVRQDGRPRRAAPTELKGLRPLQGLEILDEVPLFGLSQSDAQLRVAPGRLSCRSDLRHLRRLHAAHGGREGAGLQPYEIVS